MAGSISGFNICMMVFGALILTVGISTAPIHAMSAPDVPQNLQASATHDSVTLTWDDPDDDSITGYKILRKIANPQTSVSVYVEDTGNTNTVFIDNDVAVGQTYVYRIVAINPSGQSERSDFVQVTIPPSPPQNPQASATHDSVTISWDDPDDDSITGYRILRGTPSNPDSLDTLVADTGNTDTTFADTDISSGQTYLYVVAAINPGGESPKSDPVKATTPSAITDSFDNMDSWTVGSSRHTNYEPGAAPFNSYTSAIDSQEGNPAPSIKFSGDGYAYDNYITQTVDLRPFDGNDLSLSIDYRLTTYPYTNVANAALRILDENNTSIYYSRLNSDRPLDTGWRTSHHDITDAVAGHDSITVRLYFGDAWGHNHHQKVYFDNFYLGTTLSAITDSFDDGDSWTLHSYQYDPDYHNPTFTPFNTYTFTIDSQSGNPAPSAKISGDGFVYDNEIQRTIDLRPFGESSLFAKIDYKLLAGHANVANAALRILDENNTSIYYSRLDSDHPLDTRWRTSHHDITDAVAGHDSITVKLSVRDAWATNWNQIAYFDNFYLGPLPESD